MVTPKKACRYDMEDVVGSESMFRRMAGGRLLEKRLECGNVDRGPLQERFSRQVAPECIESHCSVLRCHPRVTTLLSQPNRDLESVGQLHPMKPGDGQSWRPSLSCDGEELVRLFALRQREVNTGEEVRVSVTFHPPAMALSICWTMDAGSTPLKMVLRPF